MPTSNPSVASSSAVALPMPESPPVMIASRGCAGVVMRRAVPTSSRRRLDRRDPTEEVAMGVTSFSDLPLADRDREGGGAGAEKRVGKWAGAEAEPNQRYRDAHVWYDADKKQNFTA